MFGPQTQGGEQYIASKDQLTVLNSLFEGSTCFDNKNLSWQRPPKF